MARCAQCKTTILFGGAREGDVRFCGAPCRTTYVVTSVAQQCPPELVASETAALHAGPCPLCRGPGPVDVHMHYTVISIVAATFWKNLQMVSCRACARKRQIRDTITTGLLGWWGVPHGLVMTPIQITRNFSAMFGGPDPSRPSEQLVNFVRLKLAGSVLANAKGVEAAAAGRSATSAPVPSAPDYSRRNASIGSM